jgi:hypothetical protein
MTKRNKKLNDEKEQRTKGRKGTKNKMTKRNKEQKDEKEQKTK